MPGTFWFSGNPFPPSLLAQSLKAHRVMVLGAGFSKPAGGPLLNEVLAPATIAGSRARGHVLEHVRALLEKSSHGDLETLFTQIWQEARTGGSFYVNEQKVAAAEIWNQLAIHLTSMCAPIKLRRGTRLWANYGHYLATVYGKSKSLSFVTFNYDCLLEQLLDDAGLRYDYGKGKDLEILNGRRSSAIRRYGSDVTILKMHGSANWGFCRGCRKAKKSEGFISAFEDLYVPDRRRTCQFCNDRYLEPGVVPPIQAKAGAGIGMDATWTQARSVLDRAGDITVIGYSLPAGDGEARSLLRGQSSLFSDGHRKTQATIVCGPNGASSRYQGVFGNMRDTGQYIEEFLAVQNS